MQDSDHKNGKPGSHGSCNQVVMLFFALLLLVASFIAAMVAAGWFLSQGGMIPGISMLLIAGVCALTLMGIAAAALVLRIMQCCAAAEDPRPEKA